MFPLKAGFLEEAKDKKTVYENDLQMLNKGKTLSKEIVLPHDWEFQGQGLYTPITCLSHMTEIID